MNGFLLSTEQLDGSNYNDLTWHDPLGNLPGKGSSYPKKEAPQFLPLTYHLWPRESTPFQRRGPYLTYQDTRLNLHNETREPEWAEQMYHYDLLRNRSHPVSDQVASDCNLRWFYRESCCKASFRSFSKILINLEVLILKNISFWLLFSPKSVISVRIYVVYNIRPLEGEFGPKKKGFQVNFL